MARRENVSPGGAAPRDDRRGHAQGAAAQRQGPHGDDRRRVNRDQPRAGAPPHARYPRVNAPQANAVPKPSHHLFDPRPVSGLMESLGGDSACLRQLSTGIGARNNDPIVSRHLIGVNRLRPGVIIEGVASMDAHHKLFLQSVEKINGLTPEAWRQTPEFDKGVVIAPDEQLRLESEAGGISMRIVDLLCPIGKGQRALIVAGSRTGKTILLQQMAQSVVANHPKARVVMLLVDERPEEITDMLRNVKGEIYASSNDRDARNHLRIARLATEYVKRRVESGEDVVLFLDSLTRLGRAFNAMQQGSGRTMTGGVDIRALEIPRQIFGAARKIENGGSLTIVASILVDTGSRMDELIFQEFKGTGNSEIVLDRKLADERIFPAIDISKSGTRREELLWKEATPALQMMRRYLSKFPPRQAMQRLIELVKKTPDNSALVAAIAAGAL